MKKLLPFLVLGAGAVMLASGGRKSGKRKLPEVEAEEGVQIYVFEASWCPACQKAKPALLEVSERHPDIPFRFIDFDAERKLADQLGVDALPTVIAMVNGEEVQRVVGAGTIERYEDVVFEARDIASGAISLPERSEDLKKLPAGD